MVMTKRKRAAVTAKRQAICGRTRRLAASAMVMAITYFSVGNLSSQRLRNTAQSLLILDIEPRRIDAPAASTATKSGKNSLEGPAKIVGFTDNVYSQIAVMWYERFTRLGYKEHLIICTDHLAADYFANEHNSTIRFEAYFTPNHTEAEATLAWRSKKRLARELMFAIRWKFVLEQLKNGISLVLTDVDNIFNRYVPLNDFLAAGFDIIHAFEPGGYPLHIFDKQGFTVCGGMSFIKANNRTIKLVEMMLENGCRRACDDQVVLNELIANKLDITWDMPPQRFENGTIVPVAPTRSMTGVSSVTGHSIKVWDGNFAYRGMMYPEVCPPKEYNWVAMPAPVKPANVKMSRETVHVFKKRMFDQWDAYCGASNETQAVKLE
jgi:hypothetical protein